jgi:hypothetical protein
MRYNCSNGVCGGGRTVGCWTMNGVEYSRAGRTYYTGEDDEEREV